MIRSRIRCATASLFVVLAAAKIPGLSIAVVTDLKLRWANGYGTADLENSVPATADTVYRLASIDKTITATAIMQLVEAGRLRSGRSDSALRAHVPNKALARHGPASADPHRWDSNVQGRRDGQHQVFERIVLENVERFGERRVV